MSYYSDGLLNDNLQRLAEELSSKFGGYNDVVRTIQDRLSDLSSMSDQFASAMAYAGQIEAASAAISKWDQVGKLKAAADFDNNAVQVMIQRQAEIGEMACRMAGANADIRLAQQRFAESLVPTEALLSASRLGDELLTLAVQPQLAFQEFARQQLELAATASEVVKNNRLMLIGAAADLLRDMNSGMEFSSLMSPVFLEHGPDYKFGVLPYSPLRDSTLAYSPTVNVYTELALEVDAADFSDQGADIESVVLESLPAQVTQLGQQILRLVYDLTVKSEREGMPALFKPTSKTFLVGAIIPTRVATDEQSFGEIVDQLYFLLYEGSGAASRLREGCSDDQLAALWRLKHLRTGVRHDVGHGGSKDVEKKNRQIGEAYKSLIAMVTPRSRSDWTRAQVALYGQLVEMLEFIWYEGEEKSLI